MYKLKYDFRQYNNVIATYINVLINNSMASFQQQIRNGQVRNSEHDADALAGCIQNLEEYLYYNYRILNEYTRDGQMPAFIQEAQYMGLLKRASYANFGYEDVSYLHNSKTYLERLRNVTAQMRDYRAPFDDGYGER